MSRAHRRVGSLEESDEMVMELNHDAKNPGEISLASLLNILWRRRLIVIGLPILGALAGIAYGLVVTPLYLATATIRPGITSFNPNGGSSREWRLKDLTRWYESGLYRYAVGERLGVAPRKVPLIRAGFIQRGLQNIQGGDVITLTVMDASPENARTGLEASIGAFADYALADTLSNSLVLTRRGLKIRIDEFRRYQTVLEARVDSLDAELAVAQIESLQIDDDLRRWESDIAVLDARVKRLSSQRESVIAQGAQIAGKISELESATASMRSRISGTSSSAVPSGIRPDALLTDAEVYRGFVTSTVDFEARRTHASALADSLEHAIVATELERDYLRLRLDRKVDLQRASMGQKLQSIRKARDFGVPNAIRSVEMRVREKLGQLYALSPIEKVGRIEVTDTPVRPRKQRAVMILSFLGLISGLAGAYVFDYVWANRGAIFRA